MKQRIEYWQEDDNTIFVIMVYGKRYVWDCTNVDDPAYLFLTHIQEVM